MSEQSPADDQTQTLEQSPEAKEQQGPQKNNHADFKVYRPSDAVSHLPPSLPDAYFEPTAADLKEAQAALTARAHALVDAPLQLKATREATEKAKRERWPLARIRVRFPDRTQLEKVFPSTDKIKSVYAFVRELLRDDVKPVKFILYQSPPKRDLKVSDPKVRGLSLIELQLAPSSVLLLRFEDESLNHANVTAPLLPEVLAQVVDLPVPPDPERSSQPSSLRPSPAPGTTLKSLFSGGEKKIPHWFKMGKK